MLVLPASFTVAWISTAAAADVTGLWLVGAVLVAVGSVTGAALMLGMAAAVDATRRRQRASAADAAPHP
ncbi:hypothetical protein [Arthrobacter sp. Ld5]|uniref:hypothetical protein n=1 Tax=Arthrobacter sp. Ld5 TaxID=649152 RepID=UPI003EB99E2D